MQRIDEGPLSADVARYVKDLQFPALKHDVVHAFRRNGAPDEVVARMTEVAMTLSFAAAIFGLFWLAWILWTTISKGVAAMNLDLFTMMTPPPEQRGGLLNAFFGSAVAAFLINSSPRATSPL